MHFLWSKMQFSDEVKSYDRIRLITFIDFLEVHSVIRLLQFECI